MSVSRESQPPSAAEASAGGHAATPSPTSITPFVPCRGLRNAHLQTIVGTMLPAPAVFPQTVVRPVDVSDGDQVVVNDDQPEDWSAGDRIVLMMHGLSGCHESGYMMRIAHKLNQRGVRTFRMDHRGCGAASGLASKPYHAGRIDDLHRVLVHLQQLCPGSPLAVAGFSLSGNLLLRYLGDSSRQVSSMLMRAVAVCPPIDLRHCVLQLSSSRMGKRYDRYFTRRLLEQISDGPQWREDVPLAMTDQPPNGLYGFDDLFTAPASGFASADDYYRFASSAPHLQNIQVPTTILAAADDPLVSSDPFEQVTLPPAVTLHMTDHGGHLGYLGRPGTDQDRRWMDWRVVEWLLQGPSV